MLVSLYIENFGLVDRLELEFGTGLNVLTGETGAGKSILVEALQVSLGGRSNAGMIRTGRERALVQSTFDPGQSESMAAWLSGYGLDSGGDGEELLILSRELNRRGRNICRVNGRIVNLGVFRELAGMLVDMHGQHDQHSLLLPDKQLRMLDRYGGPELGALVDETRRAYREWQAAARRRDEMINGSRERQQRMDMLQFQINEIDAASLSGEDEAQLHKRRDMLANAERIGVLAEAVLNKIHRGRQQCPAAVDLLGESKQDLEEFCRYIPEGKNCLDNLHTALYLVEDTAGEMAAYLESVEINPEELNYVEERLNLIEQLKKKYADSLAGILEYRQRAAQELEEMQLLETDAAGIDAKLAAQETGYHKLAGQLTNWRIKAARRLEEAIKGELQALEMPQVRFAIEMTKGDPSASGSDKAAFMFSPNPGEPLCPLSQTASGGELSRVMLAIRSVLAASDNTLTLVFDEIDAGIGGRTIHAMAEKLEQLGARRQIICITHAAAVAASAATHYLVHKSSVGERTSTHAELLQDEARLRELKRMLGGDEESELLTGYVRKMMK